MPRVRKVSRGLPVALRLYSYFEPRVGTYKDIYGQPYYKVPRTYLMYHYQKYGPKRGY